MSVARMPKLIVTELWGLGDLVIATAFLQAVSRKYAVTLLAKPYALDLQPRLWPDVRVVPFVAPWTAFRHKYRLLSWPWREILQLRWLGREKFEVGVSARWDPRDHLLLTIVRARRRLGFPRLRSHFFLTEPQRRPGPLNHRYESWRVLARALDIELPPRERLPVPQHTRPASLLVHTGAGQPLRVWPLERYRGVVAHLRALGYSVQVACDLDQRQWWLTAGETGVVAPRTVTELLGLIDQAGAFLGNDSGPSHLAGVCGAPTFTLFGPQLPEWFAPLSPAGEWLEGKPCPYKPCSDYCRFPQPYCMINSGEAEVRARVTAFLARVLPPPAAG
jgi:heptosyltransferase-2